jgi:hypothetical protein
MTGLVRKATLLTAAGLFIASAAMAGVPSAVNSTVPACVRLVGAKAGVPDPHGSFTIVVRDVANNPINGASVVIDLAGCTDLRMCNDQLDLNATVNCPAKTTRKFTDISGSVTFIVLGGSNGSGNATTLLGAGKIFANGTQIGSPTVSAFDLDGGSGVAINDLSVWLGDFGTAGNPAFGRSDFDCNNAVGINDLSVWLTQFGFTTSVAPSCTPVCP